MKARFEEKADAEGQSRWLGWKVFGLLLISGVVASLAVVPYTISLFAGESLRAPAWVIAVTSVISELAFTLIALGLGLWLGSKVGLGAPDVRGMVSGDRGAFGRVRAALPLALGLGVITGVILLGLGAVSAPLMPEALSEVETPSLWQGLLVSFGAAVREEIWLRLGLVGVLAWLGTRLARRDSAPSWVIWTSIVLAALLFGAIHLPQTATLGDGLTVAVTAVVLALNGLLGVVCGWLYWKRGLVAAMAAHLGTDLVLKVVAPAVALTVMA